MAQQLGQFRCVSHVIPESYMNYSSSLAEMVEQHNKIVNSIPLASIESFEIRMNTMRFDLDLPRMDELSHKMYRLKVRLYNVCRCPCGDWCGGKTKSEHWAHQMVLKKELSNKQRKFVKVLEVARIVHRQMQEEAAEEAVNQAADEAGNGLSPSKAGPV